MNVEELIALIRKEGNESSFEWYGFNCKVKRHPEMLHLCGYVEVKKPSLLFGMVYEDGFLSEIKVHGGLTYSGKLDDFDWCLGFDCAHCGDLSPSMLFELGPCLSDETYRDMNYVTSETKKLAVQLRKLEETGNE